DGSEKAVYNLFKGGMRAFTGAIGKKHPDAYKVKTPVATIGIRGTGHNTRVCSGDCTGSDGLPLPDGLYHSTWEGTTYVANDFGTSTVPFGNSVYVQDIDSPAEETNEASQVTAVQPSMDTLVELVEENQEQVTYMDGEQLVCEGGECLQEVIVDGDATEHGDDGGDGGGEPPTIQVGLNQVSVAPPQPESEDSVDISLLFETTEFIGPDGPIGAYGTDINDGPPGTGTLATIDPDAILASSDPAADDAKALINNARANPANDALFAAFDANPASIAEFTVDSGIGFGRWFEGLVLLFESDGSVALKELQNDESLHFIFGNSPAVAAANAIGTYDFIGGTNSTGSIGDGATSGQLTFDFAAMTGTIAMTVTHGLIYTIEGDLLIDVVFPSLFADDGTLMATTTSGNCSLGSGCTAFVEGSFFGPLDDGAPDGAGLEYDIDDNGEIIMGVAAFTRVPNPPPSPELIQVQNRTLLGIETNLYRGEFDPDNSDGGIVSDTTVFEGDDSAGTYGLAGFFGTEFDEDDSGMGVDETLDILITIDPDGIDTTSGEAKDFLDAARQADGGVNNATIDGVALDPATVVPGSHYSGNIGSTNYSYGRWTYGRILFVDEILDGPNAGEITVEVDELGPDQYFHYLHGETADINFGTGATGTYEIVPVYKGTNSTGTHDGIVGLGVQSGSLRFDFTSLNGEIVDMVIDHDQIGYTVNGDLYINPASPGEFSEADNRVFADTDGGLCDNNGCETIIDGSFFGALDGTGANGAPGLAGLDYEIVTEPFVVGDGNSIIGNAVFSRSGTAAPIPDTTVIPDRGLVAVLPNQDFNPSFPDEFADIGLFYDTSNIVGDDRLNKEGLLTTAGLEFDEDTSETFFVAVTIDPEGTLAVMDADPNVVAAQGLIADAQVSDPGLVADVVASPAKLAEYFRGDGFAYGRWADGNVLVVDEDIVGGVPGGNKTVDKIGLSGYQSLAFVTGDSPAAPLEGATGRYTFIGGTQSTTVSGATIGDGVTGGTIDFYFDAVPYGSINMTVNHLTDYNVSGGMAIDMDNPGLFFDTGVTATTVGGNCDAGCATFIDGGFAGALTGGPGGSPAHAGLEYDIYDPVDGILGVAVFERTGDAPAQD
ncbi:MAG: hypothetical protein WBN90_12625, partial [Gammaproteobacteria bacterium]